MRSVRDQWSVVGMLQVVESSRAEVICKPGSEEPFEPSSGQNALQTPLLSLTNLSVSELCAHRRWSPAPVVQLGRPYKAAAPADRHGVTDSLTWSAGKYV